MNDSIVVSHATKVLGGRRVLDNVTFEIPGPGVYGFSGVNGSGKTMLFRAISGLVRLTSGSVEVFGQVVGRDVDFPVAMGIAFESSGFWDELTGRGNLLSLADIRGVVGETEVDEALRRVGLDPNDTRPFSSYSMGMRQRLVVAQAVMESPRLLIMDEPTNSLDVSGIDLVAGIVREEAKRGATVLVASHNEPTLEALYERHFHMRDGRLTEEGPGVGAMSDEG